MPRRAPIPRSSEQDRRTLDAWAASRTLEARLVERAKIVQKALAGEGVTRIARALGIRPKSVIAWRTRFDAHGLPGLLDKPRSGKPRTYDAALRDRVLQALELPPPTGCALGWPGAGPAPGGLAARRLAGAPERGHRPRPRAQLVREHRSRVRG